MNVPDASASERAAARATTSAASSGGTGACSLLPGARSVCTHPGHTEVTLIGVSASALESTIVIALRPALEGGGGGRLGAPDRDRAEAARGGRVGGSDDGVPRRAGVGLVGERAHGAG